MRSWSPPRYPIAERVPIRARAEIGQVPSTKIRILPQGLEGLDDAATPDPGASSLWLMRSHGRDFGGMP